LVAEGRESICDLLDLMRAAAPLAAGGGIADENAVHVIILLLDEAMC
jgi:hypothetical protein